MAHEFLLIRHDGAAFVTMGRTGRRGRPRIHLDRKAYLAQKARERRAAKKDKP